MDIKYCDIGLNLFCKQFPDPERIISDAEKNGVVCILTGTSTRENKEIAAFSKGHNVFGTAGIHPHNADSAREEDYRLIEQLARDNERIVAVGECGLDYDRMFSKKENQLRCFERQIEIAEKLDMPLFLHERSASEDFIEVFEKHRDICKKSVVHCFTGDEDTLKIYLEMGFNIGITGWICDERRAADLRRAVRHIPIDRVLLETDAPYLTPRNVKGLDRTNVPVNIKYVAKELAMRMGVPENVLTVRALENTKRIFGLSEV